MNMSNKSDYLRTREEYIQIIKSELLGPGSEFCIPDSEHELISSSPISRYSIGILYPQENEVEKYPGDSDKTIDEIIEETDESILDDGINIDSSKNSGINISDENDNTLDEDVGLSSQYMPSSMGITFIIKGDSEVINGNLSFATYKRAEVSDCYVPFITDFPDKYEVPSELSHLVKYDKENKCIRLIDKIDRKKIRDIFERDFLTGDDYTIMKAIMYRLCDILAHGHVRIPHNINFKLEFSSNYIDNYKNIDDTPAKLTALRTQVGSNLWSITVMLVNDLKCPISSAEQCIFQSVINISTFNNNFRFVDRTDINYSQSIDDEEAVLELLYHNKKIYGSGQGVSVDWEIDDNGSGKIWSEYFPAKEVPSIEFNLPEESTVQPYELSMKYYSDLDNHSKTEKISSLRKLVDQYVLWIKSLKLNVADFNINLKEIAQKNISECESISKRILDGIDTLANNQYAYNSFMLANRAMLMQRTHIDLQNETSNKERYQDDKEIAERLNHIDYSQIDINKYVWRPFQIAFLLLDINSIVKENSEERNLIDLIWFPTGGGKTEAYLALTAFSIFYRRLKYLENSKGTAVIMRYTLRLLTTQQFTRASTLICACEVIRRNCLTNQNIYPKYQLGTDEINIGLWIGDKHVPNRNEKANEHLKNLKSVNDYSILEAVKEKDNKFQVLKCPWCGTKLVKDVVDKKIVGAWGYNMKEDKHFYMFCPQDACEFTKKLPIQIIDDELYLNPPTLLFGTIDKFAMLPWDNRTFSFFGVGNTNRVPELIIQDELHLISGALGTIVGMYETIIDAICIQKGQKPKIVASTATIRRAKEQCSSLYNRNVIQFPPPGIDAGDSFFAREAKISLPNGIYGRKYVGIMPAGKTKAMTVVRTIAALLQRIYNLDLPEEIKDKYWTLTVYFNSLKDLGKTSSLIDDDVKDFIIRTANRLFSSRRLIISADELTSRVTTTELNRTLYKLEKIEYSKENIENKRYASNVVLATNMISVGIDIARLNVMLMIGQPKLTSEYIQASSRVGRLYPGVSFIQYDNTKSRDRSHYEQFKSYHESFYRYVEPTGVTPFSKPARDRSLHAILIAFMRTIIRLSDDDCAINFDKNNEKRNIAYIKDLIVNRIKSINNRINNGLLDDTDLVKQEIDEFFDKWQSMVRECNNDRPKAKLIYGRRFILKNPSPEYRCLMKPYSIDEMNSAINTLTSMRNVDKQVKGKVVIGGK